MDWSVGQFGDERLDNGGAAILERMVARKTVCLKRLGGARDGEGRAGRFFGNDSVTADEIIDGRGEGTGAAAAGRHVLAIRDATRARFKTTEGNRRGLGPIGRGNTYGQPASIAFSEPEIDTIEALSPVLGGGTERQCNPHPPRSLASAAWVMARLGGWNCCCAPPGPITMRRGRERFGAMHEGRLLGSMMEQDMRLG